MNLDNTLNYLFSEVTTLFWVRLDKSMKEIGLHSGQIFILISLWNTDNQSQIELAKNLNVSPPTINKMVKNLKKNGFVNCRRSKNDGRIVKVLLTEEGRQIRESAIVQWKNLEIEVFSILTETEKLICFQILEKLKKSLVN